MMLSIGGGQIITSAPDPPVTYVAKTAFDDERNGQYVPVLLF